MYSELCLFSPPFLTSTSDAIQSKFIVLLLPDFSASGHTDALNKHRGVFDSSVADVVVSRAVQHSLFVRAANELCQVIISARIPRSHPFWQYSSEFSVGEIIYCCKYSPVKLYVLLFPQLSEPFMVIIQWLNRQA